jgi:hypothetical protein
MIDGITRPRYMEYHAKKLFSYLETRGGRVGDKFVLFIYNEAYPERSYILTEPVS